MMSNVLPAGKSTTLETSTAPVRTLKVVKALDITLSLVKTMASLSKPSSVLLAADASNTKARVSAPVTLLATTFNVRSLKPLVLLSTTRTTSSSAPAPTSPEKTISPALGALMVKLSSAAEPVSVTLRTVPTARSSVLLPRSVTVVVADTPSRLKIAVPSALRAMPISPVALPPKVTTSPDSLKVKTGVLAASMAVVTVSN